MATAKKKGLYLSTFFLFLILSLPAAEKTNTRHILILGDSHARGLAEMAEDYRDGGDMSFDVRGVSSSGLARRDFFDWLAFADRESTGGYDAYVIILGTNDGQNSRGRKEYRFGTREWEYLYTARVEYLITSLGKKGPLLWVTIPPVAPEELGLKREYLQALIHEVCSRYAVAELDTESFLAGGSLRREDGIHLTAEGGALLFERIRDGVSQLFPY